MAGDAEVEVEGAVDEEVVVVVGETEILLSLLLCLKRPIFIVVGISRVEMFGVRSLMLR